MDRLVLPIAPLRRHRPCPQDHRHAARGAAAPGGRRRSAAALGEHLVAVAGCLGAADDLAARNGDLLPAAAGLVVLQSDLTAVVSGQPSAPTVLVLAAAPHGLTELRSDLVFGARSFTQSTGKMTWSFAFCSSLKMRPVDHLRISLAAYSLSSESFEQ
jgi:hypothetical protein